MKPSGPVFDRSWRNACVVKRVNRRNDKIDKMIKDHYIGQWPSSCVVAYGLFRGSKILGVVTYSEVKRSLAEQFGVETWELSRLWISDKVPANAETFLIGRSIRLIKREHKHLQNLISFADPAFGHSGTIYRASNWVEVNHPSKNLFTYSLK